jgi:hypothetical protein
LNVNDITEENTNEKIKFGDGALLFKQRICAGRPRTRHGVRHQAAVKGALWGRRCEEGTQPNRGRSLATVVFSRADRHRIGAALVKGAPGRRLSGILDVSFYGASALRRSSDKNRLLGSST